MSRLPRERGTVRIASFTDGEHRYAAVQRDGPWQVVGVGDASVLDLLAGGGARPGAAPLPEACRMTVPFRPPRNVFCLGKNYRAHAEEFAVYVADSEAVPEDPIVFTKTPEALCGATDAITVRLELGRALDYEVELGVVIGRGGAAIPREEALAHVAAYTVVDDITARDLQQRHRQWFLGKSLPAATPIGPVLVTPDELGELAELAITCHVNGELRQSARLGEMIVGVADAISLVSAIVPLERGDIISMGTPSGVGIGFTPPRFLNDGDTVVCAIEGIGELCNTVRLVGATEASRQ